MPVLLQLSGTYAGCAAELFFAQAGVEAGATSIMKVDDDSYLQVLSGTGSPIIPQLACGPSLSSIDASAIFSLVSSSELSFL